MDLLCSKKISSDNWTHPCTHVTSPSLWNRFPSFEKLIIGKFSKVCWMQQDILSISLEQPFVNLVVCGRSHAAKRQAYLLVSFDEQLLSVTSVCDCINCLNMWYDILKQLSISLLTVELLSFGQTVTVDVPKSWDRLLSSVESGVLKLSLVIDNVTISFPVMFKSSSTLKFIKYNIGMS